MYDDETIKAINAIRRIMNDHKGPDRPITKEQIMCELEDKGIFLEEHAFRRILKACLPGVCYGGRGYYLPRDKGEADKTLEQNNKRAVALFKANKNFMEAHPEWYGSGVQGRLFN